VQKIESIIARKFERRTFKLRMRVLRLAGLLLGMGILLWIPFEDTTTRWVLGFAAAICCFYGVKLYASQKVLGNMGQTARGAVLGALSGLLVSPLAVMLMAFKGGLHGHGFPDFSAAQVQAVIGLLPYFALSGLTLGSVLARLVHRRTW
jgi:hypothetical protein